MAIQVWFFLLHVPSFLFVTRHHPHLEFKSWWRVWCQTCGLLPYSSAVGGRRKETWFRRLMSTSLIFLRYIEAHDSAPISTRYSCFFFLRQLEAARCYTQLFFLNGQKWRRRFCNVCAFARFPDLVTSRELRHWADSARDRRVYLIFFRQTMWRCSQEENRHVDIAL